MRTTRQRKRGDKNIEGGIKKQNETQKRGDLRKTSIWEKERGKKENTGPSLVRSTNLPIDYGYQIKHTHSHNY